MGLFGNLAKDFVKKAGKMAVSAGKDMAKDMAKELTATAVNELKSMKKEQRGGGNISVVRLRATAAKLGIRGRSKMNKAELMMALGMYE